MGPGNWLTIGLKGIAELSRKEWGQAVSCLLGLKALYVTEDVDLPFTYTKTVLSRLFMEPINLCEEFVT